MNTMMLLMGGAMTAFIFINFFVKQWFIGVANIILGIGCLASMPTPVNPYLFTAVGVVAVGQMVALIIVKHNDAG
jgi:hypothetical protein